MAGVNVTGGNHLSGNGHPIGRRKFSAPYCRKSHGVPILAPGNTERINLPAPYYGAIRNWIRWAALQDWLGAGWYSWALREYRPKHSFGDGRISRHFCFGIQPQFCLIFRRILYARYWPWLMQCLTLGDFSGYFSMILLGFVGDVGALRPNSVTHFINRPSIVG